MEILLNLSPDASHKRGKFPQTLLEKDFAFISSIKGDTIAFNLSLVLLPAKIDPILKKQGHKKDALEAHSTDHVKIIFGLLTEVVAFYMRAIIIQVRVFGFEGPILKCKICLELAMLLASNK